MSKSQTLILGFPWQSVLGLTSGIASESAPITEGAYDDDMASYGRPVSTGCKQSLGPSGAVAQDAS